VVSHYNVRTVIDIYATPQDRDLGGVSADVQKIVKDTAGSCPRAPRLPCAVRSKR
jgi:hypothetical protein